MVNKKQTSIRLSPTAWELREKLAKKLGITEAAVIEMAIRELARKHGVNRDGGEQK